MLNVTIAGASGFLGKNLLKTLSRDKNINIKALSRSFRKDESDNLKWQQADLFSLSSTTDALVDTDVAIFLVHSMLPATRLFQGNFQDTDLIIADNFVRAARRNKVKKIIYLGGVVPEGKASEHLESRKEVEQSFLSSAIPSIILRAGLVVGDGGSSFEILKNLALNLPAMLLPKWTKSTTQTVFINDLLDIIEYHVNNREYESKVLNAVCPEKITYEDLIKQTNAYLGKSKLMIPIPINYTTLSKFWVATFGESDMALVSPLVDSLLCDISHIECSGELLPFIKHTSYRDMLPHISKEKLHKKKRPVKHESNNVRSIQRMATNKFYNVKDVADFYFEWLPYHMKSILHVEEKENIIYFKLRGLPKPLLILKYIKCEAYADRVKFHIIGGILTKTDDTGWLEFRNVEQGKFLLASINEFQPSLPWYIYKYTQAIVHSIIMEHFRNDLLRSNLKNSFKKNKRKTA